MKKILILILAIFTTQLLFAQHTYKINIAKHLRYVESIESVTAYGESAESAFYTKAKVVGNNIIVTTKSKEFTVKAEVKFRSKSFSYTLILRKQPYTGKIIEEIKVVQENGEFYRRDTYKYFYDGNKIKRATLKKEYSDKEYNYEFWHTKERLDRPTGIYVKKSYPDGDTRTTWYSVRYGTKSKTYKIYSRNSKVGRINFYYRNEEDFSYTEDYDYLESTKLDLSSVREKFSNLDKISVGIDGDYGLVKSGIDESGSVNSLFINTISGKNHNTFVVLKEKGEKYANYEILFQDEKPVYLISYKTKESWYLSADGYSKEEGWTQRTKRAKEKRMNHLKKLWNGNSSSSSKYEAYVYVENLSGETVWIGFHAKVDGSWDGYGWYKFQPGEKSKVFTSDSKTLYFYAKTGDGDYWEGTHWYKVRDDDYSSVGMKKVILPTDAMKGGNYVIKLE